MARRPPQIPVRTPLTVEQTRAASYVGSAEHKAQRWWGGLPGAYADELGLASRPGKQTTTICPLVAEEERRAATEWVRAALAAGQCRYYEADKIFPKKVWYKDERARILVWLLHQQPPGPS